MMLSTTEIKKLCIKVFAVIFWLFVWYGVSLIVGKELILPKPTTVFLELLHLASAGEFWVAALYSVLSIFTGFLSGTVCAVVISVLSSKFKIIEAVLSPVMRIVRATPVASFIILALLWLGKERVPALISALMVMPVIWGSLTSAISETDKELLEMARMYRFGQMKLLRYVYVPSVRPAFEASCITAMGLSWKAGVAAEVLSLSRPSIGAELYYSKIYLETPSLFAWTAVVILFSFLLEKCFTILLGRVNRRRYGDLH